MKTFFEDILMVIVIIVLLILAVIALPLLVAYAVINVLLRGIRWTVELLCDNALDRIDNESAKEAKPSDNSELVA